MQFIRNCIYVPRKWYRVIPNIPLWAGQKSLIPKGEGPISPAKTDHLSQEPKDFQVASHGSPNRASVLCIAYLP